MPFLLEFWLSLPEWAWMTVIAIGGLLAFAVAFTMFLAFLNTVGHLWTFTEWVLQWRLGPRWISIACKTILIPMILTVSVVVAIAVSVALPVIGVTLVIPFSRRRATRVYERLKEFEREQDKRHQEKRQRSSPSTFNYPSDDLLWEMERDPAYQELMDQYREAYGDR